MRGTAPFGTSLLARSLSDIGKLIGSDDGILLIVRNDLRPCLMLALSSEDETSKPLRDASLSLL